MILGERNADVRAAQYPVNATLLMINLSDIMTAMNGLLMLLWVCGLIMVW